MAKLLLINQSIGYLFEDVITATVAAGHQVTVMSGTVKDTLPGVSWIIGSAYQPRSALLRLLTWSCFSLQLALFLIRRGRNYDHLLVVSNPPLAPILAPLARRPYALLLYDLYPNVLEHMGYLSSRNWLYRVWNRLNQWTFQKASIIFALSNGMVEELLTSLPAGAIIQEEIQVIPPWANTKTVYPVPPRENQFMEEAGLTGRFVVLYSGNMGITHPLETLIEAARHLHSFPNIQFLMVGDGPKRIGLQHQAEGLKNLKFLPFLSDHDFNQCLSASSIVVVMLQIKAAVVSVPSKTYNALAAGKPLLVLAGSKAEISRLVDNYQVGVRVDTNDPLALARLIQELSERPDYTKMLSKNALDLSYSFTPKLADKLVETWLS